MELHTGTHDVVHMWGMAFNMDTIYMTWVVFAIIIVVALFCYTAGQYGSIRRTKCS